MKKAIVVVSFGTSYPKTLKNSIERIETLISNEFQDYEVFRAFTAHMIIKKIEKTTGVRILKPEEMLEKLYAEGYEEVIVQPLHIIPGEEYSYIKGVCQKYTEKFSSLKVGRPIFYYQGIKEAPQDYSLFINSIKDILDSNEAVVLFGHGTAHPSGAVYGCIQTVLQDEGYDNVFVGTIEGYPTFENVIKRLKNKGVKEILLMPLLLVAGDHVLNDMASEDEDSWKSRFEKEGIKVKLHLHGLGENDNFNNLYINRIKDLIEEKYIGLGESKKVV